MEVQSNNRYNYFKLFEDKDFYIVWSEFDVLSKILLDNSHILSVSNKRLILKRFRRLNNSIVWFIEFVDNLIY